MNDLSLNLFYKTIFDVETRRPSDDVLWQIIKSIRFWMKKKWEKKGIKLPDSNQTWRAFKKKNSFTSEDGTTIRFSSDTYYSDDGSHWACKITEKISEPYRASRRWITEIGFKQKEKDKGTLSLVLLYGDAPGYLGLCQDEPIPSIPNLIKHLKKNEKIKCTIGGQPLPNGAIKLRTGQFDAFWKLVSDEKRETPIVFISPQFKAGERKLLLKPDKLARLLGPSGLVYYTTDVGFCKEMADSVAEEDLRCSNGMVRVYAIHPNMRDGSDAIRHRFFRPADIERYGAMNMAMMLRRALAQDINFYDDMIRLDGVRSLIYRSSMEKGAQRRVALAEDEALKSMESYEEKKGSLEADNELLSGENAQLREDNKALRKENLELQNKAANLEEVLDDYKLSGPTNRNLPSGEWPLNPAIIADIMLATFPDVLAFTPRGYKTICECENVQSDLLWNSLHALCTVGYELLSKSTGRDVPREFKRRTGFEYARGEGASTRDNSKLMKEYFDEYQGRSINVEAHIKKGNKDKNNRSFRIHFAYDSQSDKMVVSHVGKHLKNHSSRSIK